MNIKQKVNKWYQGEFTSNAKPNGMGGFETPDALTRHWTSRYLHIVVDFWRKEWKFILTFILLLIGTIIAIKKL